MTFETLLSAPAEDVRRGATLTEQVYDILRHGLLRGTYKPGEKITARSLARTLNVSLTPARDALSRLAAEGAIDVTETRAFIVPEMAVARYVEISRIRALLEPLAAELAVPNATEELIARLSELNDQGRICNQTERFDEALQFDFLFHHALYDAADAPVLRRLIDGLWLQVGPTRTMLPNEFRRTLTGNRNNEAVIDALRAKDPVAARDAVRKDLEEAREAMIRHLESRSAETPS